MNYFATKLMLFVFAYSFTFEPAEACMVISLQTKISFYPHMVWIRSPFA